LVLLKKRTIFFVKIKRERNQQAGVGEPGIKGEKSREFWIHTQRMRIQPGATEKATSNLGCTLRRKKLTRQRHKKKRLERRRERLTGRGYLRHGQR